MNQMLSELFLCLYLYFPTLYKVITFSFPCCFFYIQLSFLTLVSTLFLLTSVVQENLNFLSAVALSVPIKYQVGKQILCRISLNLFVF